MPLARRARRPKLRPAVFVALVAVAAAAAIASASPSRAAAPVPANGGTVTVNMYQSWVAGNTFSTAVDILPLQLAYEPLTLINGTTLAVMSRLATVTESPDAKTFTFNLKPNLKWSDGKPFTSADIMFSFDLYANPKVSIFSSGFNLVDGIADFRAGTTPNPSGFSAPNKNTFIIHLSQPYAPFLVTLSDPTLYLLPKHILGSETPEQISSNTNPFWTQPVGMGPFRLVKVVPSQYLEFVRNPYYVTNVHLSRVFVKMVPSNVAAAAVQSGDLSFAQIGTADYARMKALKYVTTYKVAGIQGIHFVVNLDKPYFQDPRVRQAMMYAINRAGIVDTVLHGLATTVNSFPFGPSWAVPKGLNTYPYDPTKAKQLLSAAGWDSSRQITFEEIPGTVDRDNALQVIVGELQAVGFNIKVQLMDAGSFLAARQNDSFDLSMSGTAIGTIDPDLGYVSLRCNAYYKNGNGTNFANYCNNQLNSLFLAGETTGIQSKRAADYQAALKIENQDLPYIVVYVPDTLYATNSAFKGFEPNPDFTHAFWNAADWYVVKK